MPQRIVYPTGTKVCRLCGIEKPVDEYYRVKARNGQPSSRCKRCFQSAKKLRPKAPLPPITCYHCATVFTPTTRLRTKYCSSRCLKTAWDRRHGVQPMRGAVVDGRKICTRCKEWKSLDQFGRRSDRKNAPLSECKPCASRRMADYVRGERGRHQRYARKYGVSIEWYEATLQRQDGLCAICRRPPEAEQHRHPRLAIDHDHDSGRVRGLLCFRCNSGLGHFESDPELLLTAYAYLKDLRRHQVGPG